MIEILIIGFITYYTTLFVVVYKCNLKEMFNNEKPRTEHPPEPEPAPDDLISKSTFTWKEPEPPAEPTPPEKEKEETAGDKEEETEGEEEEDTDAEYYEDETEEPGTEETEETEDEQEQFENLRETQTESLSTVQPGVTSDNINQVIDVIKNENATEEEERIAVNNISAMQNDQILQAIISTTNADERVNYLLNKRMKEFFNKKAAADSADEAGNKDFHNFNIKNYA